MRERVAVVSLSLIYLLCQQLISKMADFYALREWTLRLDNDISLFNLLLFLICFIVLEKTIETADTTVSAAIGPRPFIRLPAIK